jgi:transposase
MTIEVVTRAERRRFSAAEKLGIVRETLAPGASVGVVAERHGLSTGLLYTWRKRALAGAMAGFVPVEVESDHRPALRASVSPVAAAPAVPCASDRPPAADRAGVIEVELPNGWRVRVGGDVDAGALRRVFSVLDGLGG